MVLGLILVPLATGGAVLLAKSIHQSVPNKEAAISLPAGEAAPTDYLSSEASGFVLAPSEATDEPRDLKQQQSEEQQKREAPRQPPEEVDSDHAAAEVLFASESSSADVSEEVQPIASSGRGLLNSYAFANGRRSGATGGSSAGAQPIDSAPAADTKSPQGSSSHTGESADTNTLHPDSGTETSTHESSQPSANDTAPNDHSDSGVAESGPGTNDPSVNVPDSGDSDAEDPQQSTPVPYFPPADERPHVTVPEPSTLMLLGLGLLACAVASRRRRTNLK
jgi:hypothetical protein